MNKREQSLLMQLEDYAGKFSIHWMEKTRESLVSQGLARVHGAHVSLTEAGRAKLEELKRKD